MLSYASLDARQLALLYELLEWGAKVCEITGLVPLKPAVVKEMFRREEFSGVARPPTGGTGSIAKRKRLTTAEHRPYVALASDYRRIVAGGVPEREAMVTTYRAFRNVAIAKGQGLDLVCVNAWFGLARDLDVGLAQLRTCPSCGGQELVENSRALIGRCIWCGHSRRHALQTEPAMAQARLRGL